MIVGILDSSGNEVVTYTYDPWGNILSVTGTLADTLGELNPLTYRGYVYDTETQLYYLQSRYYDPEIGRFINADDIAFLGASGTLLSNNLFAYCENNTLKYIDSTGTWVERYSGFVWTGEGFNLNVQLSFLSRAFCLAYANKIIQKRGTRYWWGKGYKGMSALRIAQELWSHALAYYVGSPIKKILSKIGISWSWLNKRMNQARYMEIDYNDDRAWAFSLVWWSAYYIKTAIRSVRGLGAIYTYIHI